MSKISNQNAFGLDTSAQQLFCLFYNDLRGVARRLLSREQSGHTLQPTALVNEVFLKLSKQTQVVYQSKAHFLSIGALMMRRALMDHARRSHCVKRGKKYFFDDNMLDAFHVFHKEDLIDLDNGLSKLAQLDPRQAQIVELRFFAGFTVNEVAEIFGLSTRTVEYDLQMAKAWLLRELRR